MHLDYCLIHSCFSKDSVYAILNQFPPVFDELSPKRAEIINDTSAMRRSHNYIGAASTTLLSRWLRLNHSHSRDTFCWPPKVATQTDQERQSAHRGGLREPAGKPNELYTSLGCLRIWCIDIWTGRYGCIRTYQALQSSSVIVKTYVDTLGQSLSCWDCRIHTSIFLH